MFAINLKFTLALAAALLMGIMSACTVPDGDVNSGDDVPAQQCVIDQQCPSTDSTQGYCSSEGVCAEYATNCFGISTRRTNGHSTIIEAWGGWNVPADQAPMFGTVPVTTSYTSVPHAGTCSTISDEPHDCTVEFAGGLGRSHKEYWDADKCSFDGCNNVPADPSLQVMCQAARMLESFGLTRTSYGAPPMRMVEN